VLSSRDIKIKLLQGHITIYPLEKDTIDSAGIEVTASKFAWKYNEEAKKKNEKEWTQIKIISKKVIEDGKEVEKEFIPVPSRTSVIVVTNEIIYLNNTVAGACYSKVRVAWDGLSLLATPMKPGRCEKLLIVIQNQTGEEQYIEVDRKLAIVMLHKLNSNAKNSDKNNANKIWEKRKRMTDKFNSSDSELIFKYEYFDENNERKSGLIDVDLIKKEMKKTKTYKEIFRHLLVVLTIIASVPVVSLVILAIVLLANRLTLAELLTLIAIIITIPGAIVSILFLKNKKHKTDDSNN